MVPTYTPGTRVRVGGSQRKSDTGRTYDWGAKWPQKSWAYDRRGGLEQEWEQKRLAGRTEGSRCGSDEQQQRWSRTAQTLCVSAAGCAAWPLFTATSQES